VDLLPHHVTPGPAHVAISLKVRLWSVFSVCLFFRPFSKAKIWKGGDLWEENKTQNEEKGLKRSEREAEREEGGCHGAGRQDDNEVGIQGGKRKEKKKNKKKKIFFFQYHSHLLPLAATPTSSHFIPTSHPTSSHPRIPLPLLELQRFHLKIPPGIVCFCSQRNQKVGVVKPTGQKKTTSTTS